LTASPSYLLGDTPKPQKQNQGQKQVKSQSQKLTAKSVNVLHKPFRFIPEACLFLKAIRVAPAFITRTSTADGAITHTIPTGMVVWLSVNGTAKAGWTVVRVPHPPHSTLKAPVRLLAERIEVVWHGWPASWPSMTNDPTTTAGRR